MATIIELLPKEYGFVVIVLVLYCFLNFYMAAQVAIARKRYKVPYPTLYASESENKDAKLFNCIQRGHQNSLETMAIFFMLMILGGLKHPSICGGLGVLYIIARYFYFKGYATGDPINRLKNGRLFFMPRPCGSNAVCNFIWVHSSPSPLQLIRDLNIKLAIEIWLVNQIGPQISVILI